MADSDRGMVTAELAVAIPAVAVLIGAVVAAGQATIAQMQVVDAARAGARAAARGDDGAAVRRAALEAAGSRTTASHATAPQVSVDPAGTDVRVTVRRSVRLLLPQGPQVELSATAVAQRERGSATVLVAAVLALAVVLTGLVGAVGSVVVARHRAQSAADLGALAAADALLGRSAGPPCVDAARVVGAVGALLQGCRMDDRRAWVTAGVRPAGPTGRLGYATARASAGPGQDPDPPDPPTSVERRAGQG